MKKKSSIEHGRDYWSKRDEAVDMESVTNFKENLESDGKYRPEQMSEKSLQCCEKTDKESSSSDFIKSQPKEDLMII